MQACVVTEQQVIERFLNSPAEDTFADLYRAISPRVFLYFLVRCGDRGVAEELTQDVMLAVFRQARQLRDPGRFRTWLFKIALNAWRKHLRSHNHDVVTIALDLVAQELPAKSADPLADSCFAEWMATLAPDERKLMTMRYVEGMEHHEIASVMNLALGTVQWKLFHSRKKLAARIGTGPPEIERYELLHL